MRPLNATGRKASGPAGAESARARNATTFVFTSRLGLPHRAGRLTEEKHVSARLK